MEKNRFERMLRNIPNLSREQRVLLKEALRDSDPPEAILDLVALESEPSCPDCDSPNVVKYGRKDGLQRYKCKACRRSFNGLTQTSFGRLRYREKWLQALECVQNQDTLSQMQEKLGICRDTACRWRKRILHALSEQGNPSVGGIVEVDETFVRCSEKGCRSLQRPGRKRGGSPDGAHGWGADMMTLCIARDRSKNTAYSVTPHFDTEDVKDHSSTREYFVQ